jgi:TRAP-type C4-dicarboxylate transport system substrate-binding protein
MLEYLGASTVLMGSGEVYTSLDRGLLDGAPYVTASIPAMRFYEIAKYILNNVAFNSSPMMLVMNKKSWEKLPPDIQAMVQECADNASIRISANYDLDGKLAVPFLESKGMEFYNWPEAEVKKFNEALSPVWNNWLADMKEKGLPGKEVLDALLKIRQELTTRWK